MSEIKKYLDLGGLQQYDGKIKEYIQTRDGYVAGSCVFEDNQWKYKTADGDVTLSLSELYELIVDLQSSDHTHGNKTVLDGITADKVSAWDAAEQNAKNYADSLAGNYDAAGSAATAEQNAKNYADSLAGNYDAAGSAATAEQNAKDYADDLDEAMDERVKALEANDHSHANADVLDDITAEKVAAWDAAQTNVIEAISVNGVDATITDKKATVTIPEATTTASGVMSAADKTKLDGIEAGAEVNYISSVGDNLAVDADGKLTVTIPEATVTGVDGTTVNGMKLALDGKNVKLVDDGLAATLTGKDITLETAETATEGYLKTYVLKQGTTEIGKIDLPKELVVTGGEVIVATDEADLTEGEKYLKLTIANQDKPVYIAVKDLVDVYTAGNGIAISDANVVSVKIANATTDVVTLSADENGLSATLTGWDEVKAKVNALGDNYYTKTEVDNLLDAKLDADDLVAITNTEIEALFTEQTEG